MKISEIVIEAFSTGEMMEIDSAEYQDTYGALIPQSKKLADVRQNLELFLYSDRVYLLVKDKTIILGNLTLSKANIAGKDYLHVDGIFVDQMYRKTSALYWLVYAVKEVVNLPVIADGAIFKDGTALIDAIRKHKMFNVSRLDNNSGIKHELSGEINSNGQSYIFESTNLGFGKQIFESGLPYTWYPLFEDII